MVQQKSAARTLFTAFNYTFLGALALLCIAPLVHIFAVSFSASSAATAGLVGLWPVEFTTKSYGFVMENDLFLRAMLVSIQRVALGVTIGIGLCVLIAYPLSKEVKDFRFRTAYVWVFVFTMLFHGGLIPSYIVVKETGIMNTIWALVLPGAVNVFNCILLLNFFRALPKELLEASFIDGAGHSSTLWRVVLPVSTPALATITLFAVVGHWNQWFDGLIYINDPKRLPLQSYLQTIIVQKDFSELTAEDLANVGIVSDRTVKAAQIFLGSLPILLVYPFLQKYFMSGIVMGSVKE
ncbi:carbohydrate ABC transporter permease [Paenibacillus antri]|uniref:Carbohydrate ABC transporter permease n=1 Tax=Paenibacillus antri TaxID=2582848 RepID=A0A5R9GIH2_9BACL|nr:carbohydrate ABC transporter permease [Paenibacillus antri]TLS53188.1 carbohydrate ABC transporter permease [Paenibacillus antri]